MSILDAYKGKRVFVTGHTGFKGSWLCAILAHAGAEVTGYALPPPTDPSLYEIAGIEKIVHSVVGDVLDFDALNAVFAECQPEHVFHLAAQPLVRESYKNPRYTYETNVMGTVNVLECIRLGHSVKSAIIVTTDKVYENREWEWGYRETDTLGGHDPYSNSKSCAELATQSYRNSYFDERKLPISTVRAGNVIGGGDFAKDRIVPDCIRAAMAGRPIEIRNPYSVRPYQHVLEPLVAYLRIAEKQEKEPVLAGSYNIGPGDEGCSSTAQLADYFCASWGNDVHWVTQSSTGPHEAKFLKLDCSLVRRSFGWAPLWTLKTTIAKTVDWTKSWMQDENTEQVMKEQINAVMGAMDSLPSWTQC